MTISFMITLNLVRMKHLHCMQVEKHTHTRLDYATRPLLFTPSHMVIFILTKETLCNCIVTATATTLYICISQTNQYILVLQNDLIQS